MFLNVNQVQIMRVAARVFAVRGHLTRGLRFEVPVQGYIQLPTESPVLFRGQREQSKVPGREKETTEYAEALVGTDHKEPRQRC